MRAAKFFTEESKVPDTLEVQPLSAIMKDPEPSTALQRLHWQELVPNSLAQAVNSLSASQQHVVLQLCLGLLLIVVVFCACLLTRRQRSKPNGEDAAPSFQAAAPIGEVRAPQVATPSITSGLPRLSASSGSGSLFKIREHMAAEAAGTDEAGGVFTSQLSDGASSTGRTRRYAASSSARSRNPSDWYSLDEPTEEGDCLGVRSAATRWWLDGNRRPSTTTPETAVFVIGDSSRSSPNPSPRSPGGHQSQQLQGRQRPVLESKPGWNVSEDSSSNESNNPEEGPAAAAPRQEKARVAQPPPPGTTTAFGDAAAPAG